MVSGGGNGEHHQAHHHNVGDPGEVNDGRLPGDDEDGDLESKLEGGPGHVVERVEHLGPRSLVITKEVVLSLADVVEMPEDDGEGEQNWTKQKAPVEPVTASFFAVSFAETEQHPKCGAEKL